MVSANQDKISPTCRIICRAVHPYSSGTIREHRRTDIVTVQTEAFDREAMARPVLLTLRALRSASSQVGPLRCL